MDWVIIVLGLLVQAAPFAFFIVWHFMARRQGLVPRRKRSGRVDLVSERIVFASESERWEVPLVQVHRVRSGENSNWTESSMLESGMTFFSAAGRQLAFVGASAAGFRPVLDALRGRNIPIELVEVSAPSYLD